MIKALPPAKTKPVPNQVMVKPADETVTVEAPAQAIQLIQQAAIKASVQQRVAVQMASPSLISTPAAASSQPGKLSSSSFDFMEGGWKFDQFLFICFQLLLLPKLLQDLLKKSCLHQSRMCPLLCLIK